MRLLLWVLLATVITILSSADVASSKATPATINSDLPVRELTAETNTNGKRHLRGDEMRDFEDDDDYDDEERGISDVVNRMKASLTGSVATRMKVTLGKMQSTANKKMQKFMIERLFRWVYKRGETPLSVRTKTMGQKNYWSARTERGTREEWQCLGSTSNADSTAACAAEEAKMKHKEVSR
uniref:RxLR effector protein n=1 Tax=Phytophthora sojae TaxID=67593 RepID=G1FRY0_PHYSO|nr:Avh186a1 [Phytophthora sojae]AEK80868.1 Avh186a1 [Phytophthora sojae]